VLHYQYEKPWQTDHAKADRLRPLIDLWTQYVDGTTPPDLSAQPAPCASS